jgi:glyoxylase-like metal-dependent hydrolase (beta-lactamase superfamily II)
VPSAAPTGVPDHATPAYEVYAVKYAERDARRGDHFHPDFPAAPGDPHDDVSMPMDYFVWAVVGEHGTWVVDTGFGPDDATRRERRLLRSAADGLALVGIDAARVADVIITHLHYDHVGGFDQFPAARFHVQDREVAFATGRTMLVPAQQHGFTP